MIKEATDQDFSFFEVDVDGALKELREGAEDATATNSKLNLYQGSDKHQRRLVVLRNHVPHTQALVLVKSDYCPHCVRAKAYIAELDQRMNMEFPIYVIDTSENDMLMQSLHVQFVPTYFSVTPDGILDPRPHSFRNVEEIVMEIVKRSGFV